MMDDCVCVCVCVLTSAVGPVSMRERKEPFLTWQTQDKAVFHTCPNMRALA